MEVLNTQPGRHFWCKRFLRIMAFTVSLLWLTGCSDNEMTWKIGGDEPVNKLALVDSDAEQTVKVCLEKKGGSGYPITIVVDYDEQKYAGLLEGQCKRFSGKKVVVRFGTPSAYKYAHGTYEILKT